MLLRVIWVLVFAAPVAEAAEARVMKVLPHLLDQRGRHALSPSLYERDAYQVYLRQHPEEISALRFDVQWKAPTRTAPYKMKLELRGSKTDLAKPEVFETEAERTGFFAQWTSLRLSRRAYDEVGQIIAWRVTLWDGAEMVAAHESFLW